MYDEDNDNRKFWLAAVWTAFWLSWIVILFVIAISPAQALHDTGAYVPQPPARYDRLPDNYRVKHVKIMALRFTCRNMEAVGCAVHSPLLVAGKLTPCIVLVPSDAYLHLTDQIIRHEFGHCNGWHKSHPK